MLWRFKHLCMCSNQYEQLKLFFKMQYTFIYTASSYGHYAKTAFALAVSFTACFIVATDLGDPMSRLVTSACDREFKVRGMCCWTFIVIRGCCTPI